MVVVALRWILSEQAYETAVMLVRRHLGGDQALQSLPAGSKTAQVDANGEVRTVSCSTTERQHRSANLKGRMGKGALTNERGGLLSGGLSESESARHLSAMFSASVLPERRQSGSRCSFRDVLSLEG